MAEWTSPLHCMLRFIDSNALHQKIPTGREREKDLVSWDSLDFTLAFWLISSWRCRSDCTPHPNVIWANINVYLEDVMFFFCQGSILWFRLIKHIYVIYNIYIFWHNLLETADLTDRKGPQAQIRYAYVQITAERCTKSNTWWELCALWHCPPSQI